MKIKLKTRTTLHTAPTKNSREKAVAKKMKKLGLATGEWVRLPKPKARLHGLSRTTLLELCERRLIKGALIKPRKDAVRGIRLVFLPSLLAYLHANAMGGQQERPSL